MALESLARIRVNFPAGWTIEPLEDDGTPPELNIDTYPVKNAAPTTVFGTEWQIGCFPTAPKTAIVEFTLYEDKLIGDEQSDKVIVYFSMPRILLPGVNFFLAEKKVII